MLAGETFIKRAPKEDTLKLQNEFCTLVILCHVTVK